MEDQSFDILEKKINKILSLIEHLRKENTELKDENQKLQNNCEEKEEKILSLKEELEHHRHMKNEIEVCKEKEDRIRLKVETLLSKLKEFENIT
ncbi:hypothetical protein JW824_13730 [bacterium]|nr:hypothetical protein [bacterium]